VLQQGEQRFEVEAIPVEVVDTVGAGDSFDAGLLYGILSGWDLRRMLRLAAVCGGLSTRAAGGTAAQPTLAEALAYL
jgi:sugar/nucleoside kinase (ribokinase family)